MLPELQLWRAVLTRAVFDVQQGSQAQARDVLKWLETDDFERVMVWAGFELEQGRVAAIQLRRTFTERFERHANQGNNPVASISDQPAQCVFDDVPPAEESPIHANALLALIFTARDIRRAKKATHSRKARRRPSGYSSSLQDSAPMMMMDRSA